MASSLRLAPGNFAPGSVLYPESDGKPVGETDVHIGAIFYLRMALRWLFRKFEDVYVAADMLLYYEEGDPNEWVTPDVFVVRSVAKHDRRTYKLWEEQAIPWLVVEVTSRSSKTQDLGTKRGLYAHLGVERYLIFDPLGEYLEPRFQAFELEHGSYHPIPLGPGDRCECPELQVAFVPAGELLRVVDLATGETVPVLEEATHRAEGEARRAEGEARRAEEATRRAEHLEEEVRRLRARLGEVDET